VQTGRESGENLGKARHPEDISNMYFNMWIYTKVLEILRKFLCPRDECLQLSSITIVHSFEYGQFSEC